MLLNFDTGLVLQAILLVLQARLIFSSVWAVGKKSLVTLSV